MPETIRDGAVARARGPLGTVVAEHHGYRLRHGAPARHLGLPSPWLTVVFTLDERLTMARHVDARQPAGDYDTLVGGLHSSPAVIAHDGAQSGVMLQLSPLGSRALFGVPAGALADLDVEAHEVLGARAHEVHERLQTADSWSGRFALLDRHLGAAVGTTAGAPAVPDEVRRAWQLLVRSHGRASVAAIAREVGWSERHLATRFRTEIGLTPKVAARVIRFDRARRLVAARAGSGADLAVRCGYADQSHLVRDFVSFTGLSPTAWFAAEFGGHCDDPPSQRPDGDIRSTVTKNRDGSW